MQENLHFPTFLYLVKDLVKVSDYVSVTSAEIFDERAQYQKTIDVF